LTTPFLFVLSVKGLRFAAVAVFVCHCVFIFALIINFFGHLDKNMFDGFFWWPDFAYVGWK